MPPDDVLICLQRIQEDYDWDKLQILYRAARKVYLLNMHGSEKQTPFAVMVRKHHEFEDVYNLNDAYMRIGRHYRETYHPHGQRMLQFDDTPYEDLLRQGWEAFYPQEAARLAEEEEAVVIAILSMLVYTDEPAASARR